MLEAVGENLLVKKVEKPKKNSLILTSEKGPVMAEVVSVGELVKGTYFAGDIVFLDDFAGVRLEYESENVLVIYEKQILARLKSCCKKGNTCSV